MRIDLTGKTAIVTGSSAGIGLAAAKGFAAAGTKVIVNGRTGKGIDSAVEAVVPGGRGGGICGGSWRCERLQHLGRST